EPLAPRDMTRPPHWPGPTADRAPPAPGRPPAATAAVAATAVPCLAASRPAPSPCATALSHRARAHRATACHGAVAQLLLAWPAAAPKANGPPLRSFLVLPESPATHGHPRCPEPHHALPLRPPGAPGPAGGAPAPGTA